MLNKSCKINFVNENDFKCLVCKYIAIDMLVYIYIYRVGQKLVYSCSCGK